MSDELELTIFVRPEPGERITVIVVDRIADIDGLPPYCVHGRTTCVSCGEMCYLGSETVKSALSPGVFPCCIPCAKALVPRDETVACNHLEDHRRADGPHDE